MFDIIHHPPPSPERSSVAAGVSVATHLGLILLLVFGTGQLGDRDSGPEEQSIIETAIRFLLPPDKPGVAGAEDRAAWVSKQSGSETAPSFSVKNGRPVPRDAGAPSPMRTDGNAPLPLAEAAAAQDAFTLLDVDSSATRDPESAAPVYPPLLQAQGIEGMAIVRFVVDTSGRADLDSYQLIDTNHPLFNAAVLEALPGMKFRPATIGAKKVRQLVELPFAFRIRREP